MKLLGKEVKRAAVAVALITGVLASANVSYTLEGCRSTKIAPGYDLAAHDFVCEDDDYVTGNLKPWAELDLVPHRATIWNKSNVPESFTFTVGGDYLKTAGGDTRGWDYVSELKLNTDLSNDICTVWAESHQDALVVQTLQVTADGGGVGGAYTTIYRRIAVNDYPGANPDDGLPAGAYCVADYYQRLALGSSEGYTGSSLQSNLWNAELDSGGVGEKRVSIPQVLAQTVEKSMDATQGGEYGWSVTKTAEPANVNLGDTCDPETPKSQPVTVTVEWHRTGPTAAGEVEVTTYIKATNRSMRPLDVNITDQIYSGVTPLGDPFQCPVAILQANVVNQLVCTHTVTLSEGEAIALNDTATVTYHDPYVDDPDWPIVGFRSAEASAVLVSSGENANETATVTDHEWLESLHNTLNYAVDSASNGSFDNYPVLGTVTKGDVNWTSATLSGDGSVTFSKTLSWDQPDATIDEGLLFDTAVLTGSEGLTRSADANITIIADATVKLTIEKTIEDILQDAEQVDFNFTVTGPNDYEENVTISFAAGDVTKSETLSDLVPGIYTVTENAAEGFIPVGDSQAVVDLSLPTCGDTAHFENKVPEAQVNVIKVTYPAGNAGNWTMNLYNSDTVPPTLLETVQTDGSGQAEFTTPLGEGHYHIEENVTEGWYQSGHSGDCTFEVNFPVDSNRTYTCQIENTMYGKVIIHKVTDPAGESALFEFPFHMENNGTALIPDGGTVEWNTLKPGAYWVAETDPVPDFDLTNLVCSESQNEDSVINDNNVSVQLNPGETVECTFTNTKRGTVDLLKLTNGAETTSPVWSFVLKDGVTIDDNTSDGALVDFGGTKLVPDEYTVCEIGVPAGWNVGWMMDVGSGLAPITPDMNNGDYCYTFTLNAGAHIHFQVDNTMPPGGDQRTIGYWKNWTTCDGHGNQVETAEKNGGCAEGFCLLDDLLPISLDGLLIDTCEAGVAILNKSKLDGGKCAGDPRYALASQLLAAKANLAAGADPCGVQPTVDAADDVLEGFTGTECEKGKGKKGIANSAYMLDLADTLDRYNNGLLCQ